MEPIPSHVAHTCNSTKGIVPGNGTIVPVRITSSNLGDIELNDMTAMFSTANPTLIGATASAQTYPLGIIYPTTFHLSTLPPDSSRTVTLFMRSTLDCKVLQALSVSKMYNNIVGIRVTQPNTVVLQITGLPLGPACTQQVLGVVAPPPTTGYGPLQSYLNITK
jgi:hypothetical protein